ALEPDAEAEIAAETEDVERPSLEDTIILGLLGDETAGSDATLPYQREATRLPPDQREATRLPPSDWAGPEATREESEIPRTNVPVWEVTLGKRSVSVLSVLLYGVIILGGAPLLFLLMRFIGPGAAVWSGFSLYLVLYTLAVAVTLAQWLFNSSLTKTLREVEGQRDAAIRSRAPLESRVKGLAAANASLQKRTLQLQAVAQISHVVASILDQDRLVQEAANLICDRFDFYHVGLFLVDEAGEWAVLRAGTGEAGIQMLAQGHRFRMKGDSVVGRCLSSVRPRLALDTTVAQARLLYEDDSTRPGEADAHLGDAVETLEANSLLPRARSEIVLPLLVDGRVIGALDVYSVEREAFSEEDASVFQTMAGQLATALNNARTLAETRGRLEKLERSRAREQRARLSPARVIPLYERAQPGVRPLGDIVLPEVERAVARREAVAQSAASDGGKMSTLVAPITLRDQVIGSLGLQELESERQWADDEVALVEAVADQMALAIENARLLETTRRRAERERLTADITAHVRASTEVDTIMRTAIRELGQALRASDGLIRLRTGSGSGTDSS
ncbi:MAG: GAF domain-containing protein, partial [Chloroflexota bacterium]|nr:GAF domain-containing protein [Chloroflexota bacterium]